MKKKMLGVISLVIILSVLTGGMIAVKALKERDTGEKIPKQGTVVEGFKVKELNEMPYLNATTILFEHKKTGALLLYVQNDDKNKAFNITFKTPVQDHKGATHVLEHSVLEGSKKYPNMQVKDNPYITYANAYTQASNTSYVVGSMEEEELLKLVDMYMDCVLNPMLYEDPMIFAREAWRYEKTDEKTPLTVSGTVYNEMKGWESNIYAMSNMEVVGALFKGSIMDKQFGGKPEEILQLTYEEVLDVHKTYYHPSNAFMTLYGDLDYRQFLKQLDEEHLSKYKKKKIVIDEGIQKVKGEPISIRSHYPALADATTKDGAMVHYNFALTHMSSEERGVLQIASRAMNEEMAPIQQAFKAEGLGEKLFIGLDPCGAEPYFVFQVQHVKEGKEEEVKGFIEKELQKIVQEGLPVEVIEKVVKSEQAQYKADGKDPHIGNKLVGIMGQDWGNGHDIYYSSYYSTNLLELGEKTKSSELQKLIKKFLVDNSHTAFGIAEPSPGLVEEKIKKELETLKVKEESMTLEEIKELIGLTETYKAWNSTNSAVAGVANSAIEALRVEVEPYVLEEVVEDGIKYVTVELDEEEVLDVAFRFNTSSVPAEKLHYYKLFTELVGKMDTKSYTKEEIASLKSKYFSLVVSTATTGYSVNEKGYEGIYLARFRGEAAAYEEAIGVIEDILYHTKLSDTETLLSVVKNLRNEQKVMYQSEPSVLLYKINTAVYDDNTQYLQYIEGLDYYHFLGEVEKQLETSSQEVVQELEMIQDRVMNKTGLLVEYVGDKDHVAAFKEITMTMLQKLPAQPIEKQDYSSLKSDNKNIAIKVDTPVNYNMIVADTEALGLTYSSKYIPLMKLIEEKYLTPQIRDQNNAYGSMSMFVESGLRLYTYRDPHVDKTKEVYEGVANFIRNYAVTQEELNSYIVTAYTEKTMPKEQIDGGIYALYLHRVGKGIDAEKKALEEIKATTVDDFKEMAEIFEKLNGVGAWLTVASQEKIEQNNHLYDAIMTLE
ncbi:MAG: insulinase family protein [Cellulosilyticaceae bacterium]